MRCFFLGFFPFLVACSKIPQDSGVLASRIVEERTGNKVQWVQDTQEDEALEEKVALLLKQELSLDVATQISLLYNRSLQALFEDIGVSRADLVQAGLLQNPVFAGIARAVNGSPIVNTEFSLLQNFIDVFSIPLRKKIAGIQLEKTELKVADAIIHHIARLKSCYFELQGEMAMLENRKNIVEVQELALELAEKQEEAGNAYAIEVVARQKALYEAKIAQVQAQTQVIALKEKMNNLMGLWGANAQWTIPSSLPLPADELVLDDVEKIAIANRLDLKMATQEIEILSETLGLHEWWAYTKAQIGISREKDSEGIVSLGPIFELEIPIFNYGQADKKRLFSKLKASYAQMTALAVSIRAEVRASRDLFLASQDLVRYFTNTILPLQEKNVTLSQKLYNSMSIGSYALLDAKRQEFEGGIEYAQALKKYWLHRVALENAVGGKELLMRQT